MMEDWARTLLELKEGEMRLSYVELNSGATEAIGVDWLEPFD